MPNSIHVMTGATSGLGLLVAKRLARRSGGLVIAGARNPEAAAALKAAVPPSQLLLLPLDISSLTSVRRFCDEVRERLDGGKIASILCIAGLQILRPAKRTEDGVDETFATNFLGHFALVRGLMDALEPGATVVTTGSGTENPENPIASRFGFLGADFPDADSVALGRSTRTGRPEALLALDRYATSKLCTILYALDMAERVSAETARFICFDPGLMPGTRLARDRSGVQQFAWRYVMPFFQYIIPGVSSPRRSARALVDGIVLAGKPPRSGSYVEFTGKDAPCSSLAKRQDLAADLHDTSERIVMDSGIFEARATA
jgi:NAD(P)-dependent dehydrogenase (short-subunit alcohol dehydrogenase family)